MNSHRYPSAVPNDGSALLGRLAASIRTVTCLAAGLLFAAGTAQATVVGYVKTTTPIHTTVPGTFPGPGYTLIYSAHLQNVQAGDVVTMHFRQELTYGGTVNCEIGNGVVVATSPTAVYESSPGYIGTVCKRMGNNLSYPMEAPSDVEQRTGSFQFSAAYADIYVNVAMWADNIQAAPLTLPATYGELVATLERGVTRYESATMHLPTGLYRGTTTKPNVPVDAPTVHLQYSIGPVTVPTNTMVCVRYNMEATSEVPGNGGNQTCGRRVIQGTSATDTSGVTLLPSMQTGINWNEHHHTMSHATGLFYGTSVSNAFFNTALYCYGWSGQPLWIEPGTLPTIADYVVEMRPASSGDFFQTNSTTATTIGTSPTVIYSVGPININSGQVVEVRYACTFKPTTNVGLDVQLIRATSPTATSGTTIQRPLMRHVDPVYTYNTVEDSTADQVGSALTNQYYNVVANTVSGTTTAWNWGQLQAVKR